MLTKDSSFMMVAISEAQKGMYSTSPNPRVGCVLVSDDQIISKGFHESAGSAHAEVNAIRALNGKKYNDVTAYVTLEPCCHHGKTPPCVNALIEYGVKRVVIGMLDPNPLVAGKGVFALNNAGIDTLSGICKLESEGLNRGFIKRMNSGEPWVAAKTAVSLDGYIGLETGESKWITSELSRMDAMTMRARSCAIITGIQTVIVDDPLMNIRDINKKNLIKQPDLIILDSSLSLPMDAQILQTVGVRKVKVVGVKSNASAEKVAALKEAGCEVYLVDSDTGRVTVSELKRLLASFSYNEVMIESGSTLLTSLLNENFLDELVVYQAPVIFGLEGRPMVKTRTKGLGEALKLKLISSERIGEDLKHTYCIREVVEGA